MKPSISSALYTLSVVVGLGCVPGTGTPFEVAGPAPGGGQTAWSGGGGGGDLAECGGSTGLGEVCDACVLASCCETGKACLADPSCVECANQGSCGHPAFQANLACLGSACSDACGFAEVASGGDGGGAAASGGSTSGGHGDLCNAVAGPLCRTPLACCESKRPSDTRGTERCAYPYEC